MISTQNPNNFFYDHFKEYRGDAIVYRNRDDLSVIFSVKGKDLSYKISPEMKEIQDDPRIAKCLDELLDKMQVVINEICEKRISSNSRADTALASPMQSQQEEPKGATSTMETNPPPTGGNPGNPGKENSEAKMSNVPPPPPTTPQFAPAVSPATISPIAYPVPPVSEPKKTPAPAPAVDILVDEAKMAKHGIKLYSIPNATVGKPYTSTLFDPLSLNKSNIPQFEVVLPEGLGLVFDKEKGTISGDPKTSGDVQIKVKYQVSGTSAVNGWFVGTKNIFINPDPKKLWKDLPTDKNAPYQKPDSASEMLVSPVKHIMAASQRGRSHSNEGKFRDDDFRIKYLENTGWHILVVSDGAGSAKSSRKGSEIACNVVVDSIATAIDPSTDKVISALHPDAPATQAQDKKIKDVLYAILAGAAHKAYKAIEDEAKNSNSPVKDYAATLVVSIAKKIDSGWFVGALWVGDGGVGIYQKGKGVNLLGESDGGEFAGQTRFLVTPDIWKDIYRRVRYSVVKDFTSVILMSDGVSDPFFESENRLKDLQYWDKLWDDISGSVSFDYESKNPEKALLKWLDFWSPGNHDDRTIAILY